jgi:hypothetical protein
MLVLFELYFTNFYNSGMHVWCTLVLIRMSRQEPEVKILLDRDSIKTSFEQWASCAPELYI